MNQKQNRHFKNPLKVSSVGRLAAFRTLKRHKQPLFLDICFTCLWLLFCPSMCFLRLLSLPLHTCSQRHFKLAGEFILQNRSHVSIVKLPCQQNSTVAAKF